MTFSPATFVFRDEPGGRITGQFVVHVDDGVWGGKGAKFRAAQAKLRKTTNIKTEKAGRFTILGRDVEQTESGISVNQHARLREEDEARLRSRCATTTAGDAAPGAGTDGFHVPGGAAGVARTDHDVGARVCRGRLAAAQQVGDSE